MQTNNTDFLAAKPPVYRTAIVTPGGLAWSPTTTTTGTFAPLTTPSGTRTLICIAPATSNGAAPAYSTLAGTPPTRTDTGSKGVGNTVVLTVPSATRGLVVPSPVAHSTTTESR